MEKYNSSNYKKCFLEMRIRYKLSKCHVVFVAVKCNEEDSIISEYNCYHMLVLKPEVGWSDKAEIDTIYAKGASLYDKTRIQTKNRELYKLNW